MKRNRRVGLLCLAVLMSLLSASLQGMAEDGAKYEDFIGKRFSVMVGSLFDGVADRVFQASEKLYFNNTLEEIEAVRLGKTDAALMDDVAASQALQAGDYASLMAVPVPLPELDLSYGVFSANPEIIEQYNAFQAELIQSGMMAEMQERWLKAYALDAVMPEIPVGGDGMLTVAIMPTYPPFAFLGKGGEFVGFDVEQMRRFAAYLGVDLELVDMDFAALLPYVASGKADLGGSVYVTEERKQRFTFGNPDYVSKTALVIRCEDGQTADAETGFIAWVKGAVQQNLVLEDRWKLILSGLGTTVTISLLAQLLGTLFGGLLCWMLMRKNRLVSGLAKLYSGLVHGLPIVVLLMISYYIIFGRSDVSGLTIAVCAFALVKGADVAGQLHGAIETVDPTEIEAARSMGFSATGAFWTVTCPQALKRAMPAYCNGFVELVKATAIVGYIAIQDLTRAGDIIRSRTYDAFFPLLLVALIYLVVTTVCVQGFKLMIRRFSREVQG